MKTISLTTTALLICLNISADTERQLIDRAVDLESEGKLNDSIEIHQKVAFQFPKMAAAS